MRILRRKEQTKRGCLYCTQMEKKMYGGRLSTFCPYDKCPYHELDGYKKYTDYLKDSYDPFKELLKED